MLCGLDYKHQVQTIIKVRFLMKCIKCRSVIPDNPNKCPKCNMNYNPSPPHFFEVQGNSITKYIATSPICIIHPNFDEIAASALENCIKVQVVVLPDSIKNIGEKAFANCSSLLSFTIPSKVKSIKAATFQGCSSLESLTIPESVEKINDYAFSCCNSLTQLTIPKSVKSISKLAFALPPIPKGLGEIFQHANKTLSCTVSIPKHLSDTKFVDADSINFNEY